MQIEKNVLTLAANNSAIAAKIRQLTPELIQQLKLHGCEVTGIQVRVQVTLPVATPIHHAVSVSENGRKKLNELAVSLSDSPLKNALQRLINSKKSNQ